MCDAMEHLGAPCILRLSSLDTPGFFNSRNGGMHVSREISVGGCLFDVCQGHFLFTPVPFSFSLDMSSHLTIYIQVGQMPSDSFFIIIIILIRGLWDYNYGNGGQRCGA